MPEQALGWLPLGLGLVKDSAGTKVVYYPSNLRLYKLRMIRTFVQPKASLGLVKLFYKCKLQGVVGTREAQQCNGRSHQVLVSMLIDLDNP